MFDRPRLPGNTSSLDIDGDIVFAVGIGEGKGLPNQHSCRLAWEVFVKRACVDNECAPSFLNPNSSN